MAKATRIPGTIGGFSLGKEATAVRRRIEVMERLLERTLVIPGTGQTFGLDVILGLIPVGGSFLGAALGLYMAWEARNLAMPRSAYMRMAGNVFVDWLLGLIPGVGIIPDFFFRSNSRNLRIIRRHLDRHHPSSATISQ